MAKAKKPLILSIPKPAVPQSSLLLMRLRELDEEFLRQTKHLSQVTRKFKQKLTEKL